MRGCSEEARGCAHRAGRCAQALVHGFYLYLVNQVEGSFGWMGQQHPIRPAPSKGAFNGKLPGSSLHQGAAPGHLGQGQLPPASYMRAFLVMQSLKKC